MNYTDTLAYLYTQLPMFTRIGKAAYKADLHTTIALCAMLGNPERKLKCIHIAGTNGKGSTSHMLASVLQAAGYKTGLCTSPHLKDFRERIRVNGEMIPEEKVVQFVNQYREQFEPLKPSFFEWSIALCFHYFVAENVDVAVVETGLGGRLDSTNVITPAISVITNIGLDHTDLLGHTPELIATEKAGIIKPGVPVIIGENDPVTMPVFQQKAQAVASPLSNTTDTFTTRNFELTHEGVSTTVYKNNEPYLVSLHCDLGGIYQQNNLLTVMNSIDHLRNQGWRIPDEAIRKGLATVKESTGLKGRWQVLGRNPLIVCDTGHNEAGINYVVKQIALQHYKKLHIVIGTVNDKDINAVLALMPSNADYYFCQATLPRALAAEQLQAAGAVHGLAGNVYSSVKEAYETAKRNASADDMIFVGGSTFVVAEIL